jgi:hypothetical protein
MRRANSEGMPEKIRAILERFSSDFRRAAPGANFPFSWIFSADSTKKGYRLWQEIEELEEKITALEKGMENTVRESTFDEALDNRQKRDWDQLQREKTDRESDVYMAEATAGDQKRLEYLIKNTGYLFEYLKAARGKPGRHPKPFNVLVYHLIKLKTSWKRDLNRGPIYRKPGIHKLETNWRLICFMLLYIHLHIYQFPEIRKFISVHKKEPVAQALKEMRIWLLNIYKNFRPIDPHEFETYIEETGFKKLIVTDSGKLRIVSL